MTLPILKYLDASTTHIPYSDALVLEAVPIGTPIVYPNDYGWFVPVTGDAVAGGQDADSPVMSAAWRALMQLANDNGCELVRIDRDGPIVDGLQQFDW